MVNPIYRKTDAGHEEIRTRMRKLDHKLRALLLIINGERGEQELLQQLRGMGVGPEAFGQLLKQALIEPLPASATATVPVRAMPAPRQPPGMPAAGAEHSNLFSLYSIRRVDPPTAAAPAASSAPGGGDSIHSPAEILAFRQLYHFYTDVISQHLGLRGYMMQVKVEKATGLPGLVALRDPLHAALLKAKGDITARAITGQLDQILDAIGDRQG